MMRASVRILPIAVTASCAVAGSDLGSTELDLNGGKANVSLSSSQSSLLQTSDTPWSLAKTGTVDTTAKTVTWSIVASPGATVGGKLTVDGFLGVSNTGSGPATIGNIVVNLQTRVNGSWVTKVSDIADATNGDAATTAHVVAAASSEGKTLFTEGPGSGSLSFMDRATNTVWSLVPEVTIPAHTTVRLLFAATFDNNALNLANGTNTRTEVIVSFGNHPAGNNWQTATNVDINGNGVIDPDEAKVRSVSTRFTANIPATQAANAAVTLSDTVADIRTEGTVTFSNPVITLGATTGTVRVDYDPGASGGSITNCAHATGTGVTDPVGTYTFTVVPPVSLQTCDTETILQHTCSPGVAGCGWHDGDMVSYTQADWGGDPTGANIATVLQDNYNTLYAPFGIFEVGLDPGGFSAIFTSSSDLLAYLPAVGQVGALDANLLNPTSSSSGAFGGDVSALKLNIDFADVGLVQGTSGLFFGDLTLCNLTTTPDLNGMNLRSFLAVLNTALGGGATTDAIADLDALAAQVNAAFFNSAASTFAQDHLFDGACP